MTEHPILFNGEMVQAILDGRKTQTRQVMSLQPVGILHKGEWNEWCPYGAPGHLLVPRTTWAVSYTHDYKRPKELPEIKPCRFWSYWSGAEKPGWCGRSRPGRFLPKTLWHLLPRLEVTGVRCEQVQEISRADCIAEACERFSGGDGVITAKEAFWYAWNALYEAKGCGWDVNPWVWVVEFVLRTLAGGK